MSAADFLLSPQVQNLLKVVYANPSGTWTAPALAKASRLSVEEVEQTQEHLLKSGILRRYTAADAEADAQAVCADTSFVFYGELRAIALKSFAAAEPARTMLRAKFKDSVVRAYLLGEDAEGTVELLVVHGQKVPDEEDMSAACRKLSASIGRHLQVHVISSVRHAALTRNDALGAKLARPCAMEIIAPGDTKAKPATGRGGILESARKRWAALAG